MVASPVPFGQWIVDVEDVKRHFYLVLRIAVETGSVRIGRLSELLFDQRICRASGLLLNVRLLQQFLQENG